MSIGEVLEVTTALLKRRNEDLKNMATLFWRHGQFVSYAVNDAGSYPDIYKAFPGMFDENENKADWRVIKARMSGYAEAKKAGEEMTVEELKVIVSANTKDFKTKITDINKKLREIEKSAKYSGDGVEKHTSRMNKAFASIKVTAAVAAIHKVTQAVKKMTDTFSQKQAAQMGLESILQSQNKDVSKAKQFLNDYTKDGLIPLADAYTAYKNLASAGYSDDQAKSILQNLKDSAAFGRQGSLTMGEAVKSATEGIKNENSVLVDNAGVTKNLSVIWEEYAASIGKTVGALTEEEKRLATTQGLMRETAYQTGDAAKYTNTLAGAKAALRAQTTALSAALGSMFAPALQKAIPHVTALAEKLTVLAEKAGQVMAILFGKSVKSNSQPFKSVSDGAKSASSGIDKTTKKTKALKKALAGIDEIHNLEFNNSDSDTGGGSSGGTSSITADNNFDSPLSDADKVIDPKIAKRAEELKKSLEKAKKTLSAFTPVFKGVAAAGVAALGVKVMSKWHNDLKGVWGKSKALKIASSFKSGYSSMKGSGASFFNPLRADLKIPLP